MSRRPGTGNTGHSSRKTERLIPQHIGRYVSQRGNMGSFKLNRLILLAQKYDKLPYVLGGSALLFFPSRFKVLLKCSALQFHISSIFD